MDIDIGLIFTLLNPTDKRVMLDLLNKAYEKLPKDEKGKCTGYSLKETEESVRMLNAASASWNEESKVDPEYLKAIEPKYIEPKCTEPKCAKVDKKKSSVLDVVRKIFR